MKGRALQCKKVCVGGSVAASANKKQRPLELQWSWLALGGGCTLAQHSSCIDYAAHPVHPGEQLTSNVAIFIRE
jgi:hypothetical protein